MVSDTSTAATGQDYGPREGWPTGCLDPQDGPSDVTSTAFRRPGRIAEPASSVPAWTSPRTLAIAVFMYYTINAAWFMVRHSALRHGITEKEIIHAIEFALLEEDLDAEPPYRRLRLGPDFAGNLLEVVTVMHDDDEDGSNLVIHAMKARKQYERLLDGGRRE